jgi:ankyrin repeat protein
VIHDNLALVDFLLDHGSDHTEAECIQTHSMLATAAIFSSTGVVSSLLARGILVKQSGALEAAAYYGKLEMIGYLLDHGADIDEIGDNDWTSPPEREAGLGSALHTAAVRGQKETVHLLLERGADSTLKDTKGKTAMQKASENGHSEIVELLTKRGVSQ